MKPSECTDCKYSAICLPIGLHVFVQRYLRSCWRCSHIFFSSGTGMDEPLQGKFDCLQDLEPGDLVSITTSNSTAHKCDGMGAINPDAE